MSHWIGQDSTSKYKDLGTKVPGVSCTWGKGDPARGSPKPGWGPKLKFKGEASFPRLVTSPGYPGPEGSHSNLRLNLKS